MAAQQIDDQVILSLQFVNLFFAKIHELNHASYYNNIYTFDSDNETN